MLDIKFIRDNKEQVVENCKNRRVQVDIEALIAKDDERRVIIHEIESLRAERNKQSKGKPTPEEITRLREVGEIIKQKEAILATVDTEYRSLLLKVPNLTHPDSPIGEEADFRVVHTNRPPTLFAFSPKDHEELLITNDLIDFERGTKVAASKFYFSKNNLVRLNLALISYGIDVATRYGFQILETPDMAKNEIFEGIGFNPRGPETQIYSIENTDLSLVGTAEITVGGFHANEILDLTNGPKKYIALSHCFRTEAGAYGRTSKGLYRVHQFTKLEMFVYCKPEDSERAHEEILAIEKEIVDGLDIPYRVIDIPSGDLGGPAYRKYDIEAYMTMKAGEGSQGDYGEITSCSNCTDFQSRRLNIRYRKENGETELAHTLNGTAVVLSRFPIALVENHQQADGTILVPKKLQSYLGGLEKL